MNPVLRVVLRAERAVGDPLTRASNSREAAGALLRVVQGAQSARGGVHRARSAAVHVLALPSRRDIELLDAKVERLQRAVEELGRE